jgi:hypothetical protein
LPTRGIWVFGHADDIVRKVNEVLERVPLIRLAQTHFESTLDSIQAVHPNHQPRDLICSAQWSRKKPQRIFWKQAREPFFNSRATKTVIFFQVLTFFSSFAFYGISMYHGLQFTVHFTPFEGNLKNNGK